MFKFLFGAKNTPAGNNPATTQPATSPPAKETTAAGGTRGKSPAAADNAFVPTGTLQPAGSARMAPTTQPGAPATTGSTGAGPVPPASPPERNIAVLPVMFDPDTPLRPHNFTPRAELLWKSPRVLISPEAYKRMLLYVEIANKEVGWLGTITQLANGDFFLDNSFLLEQAVTSVETELSVEGQNKLVCELLEKGDDEGVERVNRLRFWGHSHVRMVTNPSGTDESTMDRFGREGLPWYIRGIFNKLGRGSFTIYFYENGYRINDAPWAVWSKEKGIIMDGAAYSFQSDSSWSRAGTSGQSDGSWSRAGTTFQPTSSWSKSGTNGQPTSSWSKSGTSGQADGSWSKSGTSGQPTSSWSKSGTSGQPTSSWSKSGTSGQAALEPQAQPQTWASRIQTLPAECIPSQALREQVTAEFKAKVTERYTPIFSWLKWGGDDTEDSEGAGQASTGEKNGDGTAKSGTTGGDTTESNGRDSSRQYDAHNPESATDKLSRFWHWLFDAGLPSPASTPDKKPGPSGTGRGEGDGAGQGYGTGAGQGDGTDLGKDVGIQDAQQKGK